MDWLVLVIIILIIVGVLGAKSSLKTSSYRKTSAKRDDLESIPNGFDDVLNGFEFSGTLKLSTPLNTLEHHRETHDGPESKLPKYGGMEHGIWLPKTKSWAELAGPGANKELLRKAQENPPKDTMWSDVGYVPEDGGSYLLFLKEFRKIVESEETPKEKRKEILELAEKYQDYRDFIKRHQSKNPDWMDNYLGYEECLNLVGIGTKIAKALYKAGYTNSNELSVAADKELQSIKGIGPAKMRNIRELLK